MKIAKLPALFLGCLCLLAAGAFAADSTASQPGLSATATESYQIRNQQFGDLLRPEGANGADGTRIVLYPAEPWKCMTWKLSPVGEAGFQIQNHFTGKTFTVATGGTNVLQTALAGEASQRPVWRFTRLPDGTYQISDAKTGAALTAVSAAGQSVRVVLAPWQQTAAQKWQLEKTDPAKLTM